LARSFENVEGWAAKQESHDKRKLLASRRFEPSKASGFLKGMLTSCFTTLQDFLGLTNPSSLSRTSGSELEDEDEDGEGSNSSSSSSEDISFIFSSVASLFAFLPFSGFFDSFFDDFSLPGSPETLQRYFVFQNLF
jgi:hypothetical protein